MNLYGFVGNQATNCRDLFGLEFEVALDMDADAFLGEREREPEPNEIQKHCVTCDNITIDEGRTKLKGYFEGFSEDKARKIPPRGKEWKGVNKSCHEGNSELFLHFKGKKYTPCWSCSLVHRAHWSFAINYWGLYYLLGLDRWWVECKAYNTNGAVVDTIAFDWWREGATTGESPLINRHKYVKDLGGDPTFHPFFWWDTR